MVTELCECGVPAAPGKVYCETCEREIAAACREGPERSGVFFAFETGRYLVGVTEDGYVVFQGGKRLTWKRVPGLSRRLAELGSPLRVGRARTEDFEIIYIYAPHDRNFGYAINLQIPDFSEWGYAPFPLEPAASTNQGGDPRD